ncbi:23S rRNA (pseudouridine(1915)-N(3))-methyltransferase RlmH [Saprospiraceae bacterium]|nr:23S rRNA (pseudouridine(1915)-N(3))-methyltransferase RlmH [Saprospiraceae bacterium]
MKIAFWYIGKSTPSFVVDGISEYEKRMKHYVNYESHCFPHVKNASKLPPKELKRKESEMILAKMDKNDHLFVLDEHGTEYKSVDFAKSVEQWMVSYSGRLIFLVGGAYGIEKNLLSQARKKISLGKATYSHQVIRIMFLEQLYRAFTILRGEKYHNE